jgi:hypothetical protein
MDIEKIMKEVLADIERYDADQVLIVAGMKKGAKELYDRITGRKDSNPTPPDPAAGRAAKVVEVPSPTPNPGIRDRRR